MSLCLSESVLFDLDGTLLDSLPGIEHSVFAAFAACKLEPLEWNIREMIGPPIRTILSRVGRINDPIRLDALERAFRANYDREGWRKTLCYPSVGSVLKRMSDQGYRLFVVSNKPRHISVQILESERLFDLFEIILTRDSRVPAYSGKREMIAYLLESCRLTPKSCMMVGDTMEDAEAAAANGVAFAYVTYGYGAL